MKKKLFLSYYLIAAHPGCTLEDMFALKRFASRELGLLPEQVQVFTPTPSTYASLMYYTEKDPSPARLCSLKRTRLANSQKRSLPEGAILRNKLRPPLCFSDKIEFAPLNKEIEMPAYRPITESLVELMD